MQSKIVSVILTVDNDKEIYHTLEGRLIGEFKGGMKLRQTSNQPSVDLSKSADKNKGSVVKPPTPKEAKQLKRLEGDRELTLEERIEYEKRKNT